MTGGLRSTATKSTPPATAPADGLLEGLLGAIPDAVVAFDRESRCTYINAVMRARWGWHADTDLVGRPMEEVFAGCAEGEPCRTLRAALASRRPIEFEAFLEPLKIWVSDTAHPTSDGGLVVISRDITAQRHADERVRASQEQLRGAAETFHHLVGASPFGVYVIDADFKVAVASRGTDNAFRSVQPVVGRDFAEVMRTVWPEPSATEFIGRFRRTLETGEPYHQPRLVEHREDTGERESYDWQIARVTMPDGRYGVVCHFYDLSERITFEAQLSEGRQRLQTALEASDQGVWELELATGRFVCDERGRAMHGFSPGDVVDTLERARSHNHPDDLAVFDPKLEEAARTSGRFEAEYRVILPPGHPNAGEVRWVATVARVSPDRTRLMGVCQDVTARVVPQQALRVSEARYRALTMATSDVTYRMSADWSVMQPLDGRNLVKSNDRPIRDWLTRNIPPNEHERIRTAIGNAIARKGLFELEHRVIRPDGSIGWTLSRAVPLLDEAGNILEWFGVATDVTDRVHAEQALHDALADTQMLHRLAMDMARPGEPETFYERLMDAAVEVMRSDCASIQMSHPDRGELGGRSALRLLAHRGFPPETVAHWKWVTADSASACGIAFRTGRRCDVADIANDPRISGVDREVYQRMGLHAVQTTPLVARDGRVLGAISTHWKSPHRPGERDFRLFDILARHAADLLERITAEQERRDTGEFVRKVANVAPSILYVYDLDRRANVWGNRAVLDLLHYSPEQIEAMSGNLIRSLLHPDDWPGYVHHLDTLQALADGEMASFEYRMRTAEGAWCWLLSQDMPFRRDEHGRVTQIVGSALDVTARKQAEEALHLTTHRFETALQTSQVAVFNQDRDLRYTWIHNPALGYAVNEVIGTRDVDLFDCSEDSERTERIKRAVMETGTPRREEVLVRHAGEDRWYDLMVQPQRDAGGAIVGVTCAAVDVTERRRADRALVRERERLDIALRAGGLGVYEWSVGGSSVWWSPELYPVFGVDPATFVPTVESFDALIHPDDRAELWRRSVESIDRRELFEHEYRIVRPDGEVRWIYNRSKVLMEGGNTQVTGVAADITDRKRTEETLRQQEERFRSMAEANPIGILQGTASGGVLYCNQAYCDITGYTLDDFQSGRVGWDAITPAEWLPLDWEKVAEAKRNGHCTPYEKEYVRKDGTRVPVLIGFALYGENRELSSAWIVDRTEMKRAEQALAEQRRLYQSVTDNATTALFIMDERQQCVFMNAAAEQLTGYSLGETLGRPLHDVVHHTRPDGTPYPLSECPIDQAFPRNDREQGEETFVHKDGHFYPVAFTASPLRDERGAPIGTVIEVRDISREKSYEESLRKRTAEVQRQLNELTSLYKAAPAGLCTLDRNFRYVRINDALAAINGLPVERHLGLTPHEVIPEIAAAAEKTFRTVLETGQPVQFELCGSTAVVENGVWDEQWYPVRDENGAVTHVGVVVTDITARKRAEQSLRDNEQQLRMAQDAARAGLWSFDPVGGTVYWDARTREIFGVGPDETITFDSAFALFHPDERERILEVYEASVDPAGLGRYDVEHRTVRPATGEVRWVASTGRAEFAGEGPARHAVRLAGLVTDVTDRKQIEAEREQLLSAEQAARAEVERMGRIKDEFLATLSHELRTPLNAIVGWVQILRRLRKPDERLVREGVEAIARNADAQAYLINDLLDMNRIVSGKLKMDVGPVDPNLIASTAVETVRPAVESKGLRLEVRLAGGLPQVTGDQRRLAQVLWNLLTNAVKFTPAGGQVALSTAATDRGVRFEVEDTGQGLDPAFVPRLFDRFAQADSSAARKYGGLGLGLSIVKQLVELHGGVVSAHSDGPGRGARFTIDLPARTTSIPAPPIAHPAREADGATESPPADTAEMDLRGVSILLVDDQLDSLEAARRLLTECGAAVATATSAQAALDHLRHERPHVLLSDIGMPEMDGYRLIREVRETLGLAAGDLPAAAMTAFTRDEDRDRAIAAGYQVHLAKPLRPQVLIPAVAALAGARSDAGDAAPSRSGATGHTPPL